MDMINLYLYMTYTQIQLTLSLPLLLTQLQKFYLGRSTIVTDCNAR